MGQLLFAATIGEERIVSLTLNDGLTGETAHCVMTDHNGMTWIATNSGINVYNGKSMDSFRIENERGRYVSVESLCEATDSLPSTSIPMR